MSKVSLTAIILTYNESIHLERCLESVSRICSDIVIVDSFSNDTTIEIANKFQAQWFQRKWLNYSDQLNWALNNIKISTNWVLRIDADEYLSEELISSLRQELHQVSDQVHFIRVKRLMYFMGKPLFKGGMYPIWHLKIWRNGSAHCEQRWMDERMEPIVKGQTSSIEGNLIDNNLNNISWWTQKHNSYATREAIDILDQIYNFSNIEKSGSSFLGNSEERRRWLKLRYLKLPLFIRPFLFFIVRYIFQGGFLEGKRGFVWSILQCFWYRFLVDVKISEAYKKAGKNRESLIAYFRNEYGYNVEKIG
jgi:glycosyltransferase involved in cell wall biosynthesis